MAYYKDQTEIMPNDKLTRAEMATIIVRAFGAYKKGNIDNYTDVKAEDWFKDNLAKAHNMGIIQAQKQDEPK